MPNTIGKYVGKLNDELTNTSGPKGYMNKQIRQVAAPVEKDVKEKIDILTKEILKCKTPLCKYKIGKQIRKLQKILFSEGKNMGAIFENEEIVKAFISEWGDKFTDAHLLLEMDDVSECGDNEESVVKVTNEEEDFEDVAECNESDRICEDVMVEFNPTFDKKLYGAWKKGAPSKRQMTMRKALTVKNVAVGTLLAAAIYYAYQTYRMLRKQGKDPAEARREQLQALKYASSKCNRTKNPRLCRDKFEKQMRIVQGKPTL